MKRPLAVTGLLYCAALAAAFHCHSAAVMWIPAGGAAAAAAGAVLYRLVTRQPRVHFAVVAGCVSVLCALCSLFLYQNFIVQPVIDAYAGKTVRVTGYAGDVIRVKPSVVTYTLHCDSADGKPADFAVSYTVFNSYAIEPFDKLSVTLTPEPTDSGYSLSRGVYLYAYEEDGAHLTLTGAKQVTPFAWAASLRQSAQHTFNRLLDGNAAAVAGAVLLGSKMSLPDEVYRAFLQTGTSYLIVVSGMHLTLVTLLFRRLLRRIEPYNAWLPFVIIALVTVSFMAVTGFSASVTRAGCMLLITYAGKIVFRDTDGFTSLGAAALLLTLPNPYAVGDVGMLLSFAAAFGILLWADPISRFCMEKLRLTEENTRAPLRRGRAARLFRRLGRTCVAFFGNSVAAALWVLPLSVLLFERITPLTVLLSAAAYPLTCAVLLLSLALVLLQLLPFVRIVLALSINLLAGWLVAVEQWGAALPWASVSAGQLYCYVWLAVTAVLVLCGYLFRRGRRYVLAAAVISALTLSVGGALTAFCADSTAGLTVWRFGSGYTAMVRRGDTVSLLSCGGNGLGKQTVTDALEGAALIDHVIVTGSFRQNAAYLPLLLENKQISNLLLYEGLQSEDRIAEDNAVWFYDNTRFSLALNSDVTLEVVCTGGNVFRYVHSDSASVLFVPKKANTALLPASLRRADLVLAEGEADLSAVTARRVLYLTDADSGEVLRDGEAYHLELP